MGTTLTYSIVSGPAHGTLSGTPPALIYQPAANYSGADSFTFRANDGEANSNAGHGVHRRAGGERRADRRARSPTPCREATTLTVSAPGVLGNDTDVEGAALTASGGDRSGQRRAGARRQRFVHLHPVGRLFGSGLVYLSRQRRDGTPRPRRRCPSRCSPRRPPAATGRSSRRTSTPNENSFTYVDNTFRGATQSSYASGSRVSSGGFSGGALRVRLGGENNNTINGMSGGWRRTFTLSAPRTVVLSFRYNLDQGADYESDEFSQVMASVNGVLVGATPLPTTSRRWPATATAEARSATGWQLFQTIARHVAGRHAHGDSRRLQQQEEQQLGAHDDPHRRRVGDSAVAIFGATEVAPYRSLHRRAGLGLQDPPYLIMPFCRRNETSWTGHS